MDHHRAYFDDFFQQYEYVNIAYLKTGVQAMVALYAVVAHTIRILSTSAIGIDCIVEDHTGRAYFSLRGDTAFDFYEHHLRTYEVDELILDPYALNDRWFRTCVFKISCHFASRCIVDQICMVGDIVDEWASLNMDEEEYIAYKRSKWAAAPQLPWSGNQSSHVPCVDKPGSYETQGLTKHIYAPI